MDDGGSSRAVVLKEWFLDQQRQYHLGTWEFFRNAISKVAYQTYWIRHLGGGTQQPVF